MYDQFVEKIPQIALQGYPAHQPMFVIPGGGMVPTTMAGPGAGHPAHLIGEALVFLVLSRLSNWLRASFYCQIRIQSFAEFYEVSFSPPWELMDLRNDHQSYSALLPYIHIFPSFSSASYMININIKQVSSMHAFSSVLLPFSTYFFFSFLQASSPPSIMQVCAISLFHLAHAPLFYPFLRCRPGLTELLTYFLSRSWGSTCHLDGRLHDQPSVPTHPAPR